MPPFDAVGLCRPHRFRLSYTGARTSGPHATATALQRAPALPDRPPLAPHGRAPLRPQGSHIVVRARLGGGPGAPVLWQPRGRAIAAAFRLIGRTDSFAHRRGTHVFGLLRVRLRAVWRGGWSGQGGRFARRVALPFTLRIPGRSSARPFWRVGSPDTRPRRHREHRQLVLCCAGLSSEPVVFEAAARDALGGICAKKRTQHFDDWPHGDRLTGCRCAVSSTRRIRLDVAHSGSRAHTFVGDAFAVRPAHARRYRDSLWHLRSRSQSSTHSTRTNIKHLLRKRAGGELTLALVASCACIASSVALGPCALPGCAKTLDRPDGAAEMSHIGGANSICSPTACSYSAVIDGEHWEDKRDRRANTALPPQQSRPDVSADCCPQLPLVHQWGTFVAVPSGGAVRCSVRHLLMLCGDSNSLECCIADTSPCMPLSRWVL